MILVEHFIFGFLTENPAIVIMFTDICNFAYYQNFNNRVI